MDCLKILREDPALAEEFDMLFDFYLLDEGEPREDFDGRYEFTLQGTAIARDGSGGEYHMLEDGSIGYNSSEGETGRLADSADELFALLVNTVCWHDYCDARQYTDCKTMEQYGQAQRSAILEDVDMDSLRRVAGALGIPFAEEVAPVLERFCQAASREPQYRCLFHEDDGSVTESNGLLFE